MNFVVGGTQVASATSTDAQVDLVDLFLRIWQRKLIVLLAMATALFGTIIYLNLATKTYTSELRVIPSESSTSVSAGRLGGLSSLAAVAGVSVGSSQGPTTFEVFLATIRTRELADQLARDSQVMQHAFPDEWDVATGRWTRPVGVIADAKRTIWSLLGRDRGWHPPSGARLQEYLAQNLSIVPSSQKNPITVIQYNHQDPAFARYMLNQINLVADQIVRRKALKEARQFAMYFERRLTNVFVLDLRQSIIQNLSEQEKLIMMASSNVPYSARLIEPPTVSDLPTRPQTFLALGAALALGFLLGATLALLPRTGDRVRFGGRG